MLSAEGALRGPEKDRVGLCCCGSASAAATLPQPGDLPGALPIFVPKHFQSPGVQLAFLSSSPAPHPLTAQRAVAGTRQAPGKTVVQWLLGAFRGLRPLFPLFCQWKSWLEGTAFPACSAPEAEAQHSGSCSPHTPLFPLYS